MNNYINRKLLEKEKYYKYGEYYSLLKEKYELFDMIYKMDKKRILLLSDAGYGKSTELNVTFEKFLEKKDIEYIPVPPIKLDTYIPEVELENYIKKNILGTKTETILEKDNSNLIFFIDEYDQVIDKIKTTRRIKNFIDKYSESRFIISCRSSFYTEQFADFNFEPFVLLPFEKEDVEKYSEENIENDHKGFLQKLTSKKFRDYAKNPFFLEHLIKIYIKDGTLPNTKSEYFERIIKLSIEKDLEKYDDLREKYNKENIFRSLSRMALIMETLLKNYISPNEYKKIISNSCQKEEDFLKLRLLKKSFFNEKEVIQFQPKLSDSLLTTTKLQQFETATTKSRTGKIENCLND